jgi:hypothetical protein
MESKKVPDGENSMKVDAVIGHEKEPAKRTSDLSADTSASSFLDKTNAP